MTKMTHLRIFVTFACLFGCLVLVSGCGNNRVQRYSLSGKVTYQGQPVSAGRIIFEPDSSKGNEGPQGVAKIEDGQYSTDDFGRGAISGPLMVRITGVIQSGGDDNMIEVPIPPYMTNIDLPEEASVFDFEIPSQKPTKGKQVTLIE